MLKSQTADRITVDRAAFSVASRLDGGDELAYWLTRSVEERLSAIELQRHIVYGRSRATARLQRVLEIVRLGDN